MSREPDIGTTTRSTEPARSESARTNGSLSTGCVYRPECGMPAWIEWADTAGSTSGAVEHVKVRCFSRHWFLMLREDLNR